MQTPFHELEPPHHQRDVDGLRAVAVLAVILHHYYPGISPSGFVGVDVFFVISGYVITLQLRRRADASWADYLTDFYARRVKRLLPALLLCVAVTSAAFVFLTTRPQAEMFRTGSFALVGVSNLYLLGRSSDYFSLQAQLNPFTHTWSLGVEEQFYAVYPLILALTGLSRQKTRRGRERATNALLLLSSLSVIAYLALSATRPLAAFYLMPTRFWELGLGGLTAIASSSALVKRAREFSLRSICNIAFVALLAACYVPNAIPLLATLGSAVAASVLVLSLGPGNAVFGLLSSRPMVYMGVISYSLYLWHWSILVLGKWTIGVGHWSAPILIALTVALAAASYHFVEKPLRYARWTDSSIKTVAYGVFAATAFAVASAIIFPKAAKSYNSTVPLLLGVPDVDPWPALACNGRELTERYANPFTACLHANRSAAKPHALYLVGDSHAAQLVSMAARAVKDTAFAVRFINRETSLDFPYVLIDNKTSKAATLDYIVRDSLPGDVIVVAFHRGQLNQSRDSHIPLKERVELNDKAEHFLENMRPYIGAFAATGVKMILVRDTPLMSVVATSPSCLLQIRLLGQSICRIRLTQDVHTRERQDLVFDALENMSPSVFIWDPLPYIYKNRDFLEVVDEAGIYVMWDWNHVTTYQAELIAPWFKQFLTKVTAE